MTPKFALLAFLTLGVVGVSAQELLEERVVLQTSMGNIELAFFSDVAPITARHILENFKRGNYDTNHFFRVDRGFVAQVAAVDGGRAAPMDPYQLEVARKTVPGEFQMDVKHTRGILSMGRYDDPDSGTSSFSILLGDAPHLDGQYTVFGKIISGDETLRAMETAPTRREGIFVMPKERIEICSTYATTSGGDGRRQGGRRVRAEAPGGEAQGGWTGDGTGGDSSTASSGEIVDGVSVTCV